VDLPPIYNVKTRTVSLVIRQNERTSLGQSGVVLSVVVVVVKSFSGLKTIAPESGDNSRTSSVSIDSPMSPAHPRHLDLADRASADLDRDHPCRLASVDQTVAAVSAS